MHWIDTPQVKDQRDSVGLNALYKNSAVVLRFMDEETEDINSERKIDANAKLGFLFFKDCFFTVCINELEINNLFYIRVFMFKISFIKIKGTFSGTGNNT